MTAVVKEKLPSVSFSIGVPMQEHLDEIYICGSIEKFGCWQPCKALRVKKTKSGSFVKTVRLPLGTKFEFKIVAFQHFDGVEKGRYFEELENRHAEVVAQKNKIIVEVKSFNRLWEV